MSICTFVFSLKADTIADLFLNTVEGSTLILSRWKASLTRRIQLLTAGQIWKKKSLKGLCPSPVMSNSHIWEGEKLHKYAGWRSEKLGPLEGKGTEEEGAHQRAFQKQLPTWKNLPETSGLCLLYELWDRYCLWPEDTARSKRRETMGSQGEKECSGSPCCVDWSSFDWRYSSSHNGKCRHIRRYSVVIIMEIKVVCS